MLDQNTATIITAAITVFGTLGGALGGVVLTNRHTTKLEELKIAQEKLKRKIEVIEEIYSLLMKIDTIGRKNVFDQNDFFSKGVTDELDKVKMLIHLYLPSEISIIDDFLDAIFLLELATVTPNEKPTPEELKDILKSHEKYNTYLEALLKSSSDKESSMLHKHHPYVIKARDRLSLNVTNLVRIFE